MGDKWHGSLFTFSKHGGFYFQIELFNILNTTDFISFTVFLVANLLPKIYKIVSGWEVPSEG